MIYQQVALSIAAAAKKRFSVDITPEITHPNPDFGDLSTNAAFTIAGQLNISPATAASQLAETISSPLIDNSSTAGGFVNFRLKDTVFTDYIKSVAKKPQDNLREITPKPLRIIVEYGHPNTHKMPHIGHLFSYIAGDSIARLLEYRGHTVKKVNYQGDVGPHVAKCLWAWQQTGKQRPKNLFKKVQLLQQLYQLGDEKYQNEQLAQDEIKAINEAIYSGDKQVLKDWKETRQWSLDYYQEFESGLGIEQSTHYLESQIWQVGAAAVKSKLGSVFKASQGAVIYPGETQGLHNRVFITKAGLPTYEAKEVGLNLTKLKDWEYDLTVIPTAVEQREYFQVVIAALNQGWPELKGKLKHISFGMVNLSSGKMSSRRGQILSAPELIAAATKQAQAVIAGAAAISDADKDEIANAVALGAIKYTFLRSNLGKNINFDLKRDINLDGNSGPYLQYTYARMHSILRKAASFDPAKISAKAVTGIERRLLLLLMQFPQVASNAADSFAPELACNYLSELCQAINKYYETERVIGDPHQAWRLTLISAAIATVGSALGLIGVTPLEKM